MTSETGFIVEWNLFEIITGKEVIILKFVNYCNNWGLWDETVKGEGIRYGFEAGREDATVQSQLQAILNIETNCIGLILPQMKKKKIKLLMM